MLRRCCRGASEENLKLIDKSPQLPEVKKSERSLVQAIVGDDYRDFSTEEIMRREGVADLIQTKFTTPYDI